jgi:hypothetical protein
MGFSVFDERVASTQRVFINAAMGLTEQFWFDNTPIPARVDAIYVANEDAIDHVITLSAALGSSYYPIGSTTLVARSGLDGSPAVDVLALCLPLGAAGLVFDFEMALTARVSVAMTGTTRITGIVQAGQL